MATFDVIEQAQLHAARLVERHHKILEECSSLRVETRSELGRDADQREAGKEYIDRLAAKLIEVMEGKAECAAKEQSIMAYSKAAIAAQRMAQKILRDGQALLESGAEERIPPVPDLASTVIDARKEVMAGASFLPLRLATLPGQTVTTVWRSPSPPLVWLQVSDELTRRPYLSAAANVRAAHTRAPEGEAGNRSTGRPCHGHDL